MLEIEVRSNIDENVSRTHDRISIVNKEISDQDGPLFVFTRIDAEGVKIPSSVAVWADDESVVPTVLATEWGGRNLVGCNSEVFFLTQDLTETTMIGLRSRFSQFFLLSDRRQLIVVCETAILALSERDEIVWRRDLNIITRVRWVDARVLVSQMDGNDLVLDLSSGKSVS